ncbi:MAG: hypothetical protein RL559_1723 [Pseudomonadota bacterium]|jgi:hypothetical protein
MKRWTCFALLALSASALWAQGQSATLARASELRADKLATAQVLTSVPSGAAVRVTSLEGGWALVETAATNGRVSGWVRASSLNLQAQGSALAGLSSGREAAGNTALTLGVRSIPQPQPRVNRHALIIGVGRYADPAVPPLPGTRMDRHSATQMAKAMQVPEDNIRYLQDDQATGQNIRKELEALAQRVQDGDRVFIHYSGHGTRYADAQTGGCVEALMPYDGMNKGTLSNQEMAKLLGEMSRKTDKLFVMYDACFSGGLVPVTAAARTRGILNTNDEGALRPKFSTTEDRCAKPTNVTTRSLAQEQVQAGALPQDIIHLSAARDNEISFDDEAKGGLATQYVRDCMLREAKDLDGSGAVTIDEIRQCAQEKINRRMQGDTNFKPHHLVLGGNQGFVPAWFSQGGPAAVQVASAGSAALPAAPAAAGVTPPPAAAAVAVAPAPSALAAPAAPPQAVPALSGEQALRQMFEQRNAKRGVTVTLNKPSLVIGQDALAFKVQSDRAGYVYAALAGSDGKALYMLFPNDLDQNNRIEAGQTLSLPASNWRIRASGPAGTDHLLVMVADAPRDLTPLAGQKAGPFLMSLNDPQGRAQLGALMSTSKLVHSQACRTPQQAAGNPLCSDAYGAAMVSVQEVNK